MRPRTIAYFLLFISIGCNRYESSLEQGVWIDKKSEILTLKIDEENDTLFLFQFDQKLAIQQKSYGDYVRIDQKKYPLRIEKGNLFYMKQEFIPISKSLKNQFVGSWVNNESDLTFSIDIVNGLLAWNITRNGDDPVRYYPKKNENGFTFTFDEEQLTFRIADEYIECSNGMRFQRISD